jgi:uridylate kinase
VDGIYSADPRTDPSAKRFDTMTPCELLSVVIGQQAVAGVNTVMDIVAVKMVERCGIPLFVMDGRDPSVLDSLLESERPVGTLVTNDGKIPFPLK